MDNKESWFSKWVIDNVVQKQGGWSKHFFLNQETKQKCGKNKKAPFLLINPIYYYGLKSPNSDMNKKKLPINGADVQSIETETETGMNGASYRKISKL